MFCLLFALILVLSVMSFGIEFGCFEFGYWFDLIIFIRFCAGFVFYYLFLFVYLLWIYCSCYIV